jgi:hypothetical protein
MLLLGSLAVLFGMGIWLVLRRDSLRNG